MTDHLQQVSVCHYRCFGLFIYLFIGYSVFIETKVQLYYIIYIHIYYNTVSQLMLNWIMFEVLQKVT